MRLVMMRCVAAAILAAGSCTHDAWGEVIWTDPATAVVSAGAGLDIMLMLDESSTPLFGYSLDLEIVPLPGAVGSLSINAGASGFFDQRNVITAGGSTRDDLFSIILETPDGAFVSTNTDDGSTVVATAGINDVLALVRLISSADALGGFQVRLGAGSAISDASGLPIPFTSMDTIITVVPAPISAAPILALWAASGRRRPIPSSAFPSCQTKN